MSILNFCVLRYLLRHRVLSNGKYAAIRRHEFSPGDKLFHKGIELRSRRRQFMPAATHHKQTSGMPHTPIKAEGAKEQTDHETDKNVPLIVKLLRQNREHENQQKQNFDQAMSLEQLQKNLEDIKWDTDATIKREMLDLEGTTQIAEEDSQEPEVVENSDPSDFLQMDTIEDIYMDDDVPQALSAQPRKMKRQKQVKGTPDPSIPKSDVPCSGCGASLHCQDPIIPGYLPSEKFKSLTREEMRTSMCQRCYLIQIYNLFLNVRVSAEIYPQIIQEIKHTRALVVVVIDLFDMKNSVFKGLLDQIGKNRPLFIVGNKVDMIPKDNAGYLKRTKEALLDVCESAGLNPTGKNIRHVCMVSAKTGYGIENLISKLMTAWQQDGHVYVVGSTNVGKSTLFNALLMSDYCKSMARDFISRATVSVWPGTTLNLLKFPIVNPAPWKLALRYKRLSTDETEFAAEESLRRTRLLESGSYKAAVLTGHVGLTDFRSPEKIAEEEAEIARLPQGQKVVSFVQDKYGDITENPVGGRAKKEKPKDGYKPENFKMYWCNDTPGVVNPEQVINLLEPEELVTVLPKNLAKPQCVVVKPGQVLFVTGMGRIDFVQGRKSIYLTAHVTHAVKVHVKDKEEADDFYAQNLGTPVLQVPVGDEERLRKIPSLVGREFHITGVDWEIAAADIQLSSLGWVSVAAGRGMDVTLRAYTPGGRGLHLRSPALLPYFTYFRGKRIRKTPYYRPHKPRM